MSHPRPKANGMALRHNRQCRTTWIRTLLAKAHGCGHRSQETGFDSLLPHDDASGNAPDKKWTVGSRNAGRTVMTA